MCDGQPRRYGPGEVLILRPGASVTLRPGDWRAFWGEGGDVLIGEVSTVNDDHTDTIFRDPIGAVLRHKRMTKCRAIYWSAITTGICRNYRYLAASFRAKLLSRSPCASSHVCTRSGSFLDSSRSHHAMAF